MRRLQPPGWPEPRGYANGIAASGELVFVAGMIGWDETGAFPHATVWSGYGRGYGFVPLVLPVLGLLWLRANPEPSSSEASNPEERVS